MTKSPLRVQEVRAARFRDVSRSAGSHFERALIGRGAATGDIDNDGDLDLVISNVAGPAVVLRNDTTGGHWLRLVLRDRGPNQEAIGARVWVEAGGRTQYREVHGGGGYLSANDRRLHVGLGGTTTVDRIRVMWPDGATQIVQGVSADRELQIVRTTP